MAKTKRVGRNLGVNRRLNKRRQMRWSSSGAQRVLQARVAVLDGRLRDGHLKLTARTARQPPDCCAPCRFSNRARPLPGSGRTARGPILQRIVVSCGRRVGRGHSESATKRRRDFSHPGTTYRPGACRNVDHPTAGRTASPSRPQCVAVGALAVRAGACRQRNARRSRPPGAGSE